MHTSPVTIFPTQSSPASKVALGEVMDTLQAGALQKIQAENTRSELKLV